MKYQMVVAASFGDPTTVSYFRSTVTNPRALLDGWMQSGYVLLGTDWIMSEEGGAPAAKVPSMTCFLVTTILVVSWSPVTERGESDAESQS
jgi:hypothetical protein